MKDVDSKEKMDFQTTIRMSSTMWESILKATEPSGVSAMEWIRRAIRASLANQNAGTYSDVISRAEFEETVKRLDEEIESLKTFITATPIRE